MNWRRRSRTAPPQSLSRPESNPSEPAGASTETADAPTASEPPAPVRTAAEATGDTTGPSAGHSEDLGAARAALEDTASEPPARSIPKPELGDVAAVAPQLPDAQGAVTIAITNQKGGVGKTTTTVSLAAALAAEGLDVLIIDLDPQGNATTGLGLRAPQGAPSSYRVVVEQLPIVDAAEPTSVRHLHVVPSSLDLAGAEIELVPQFSRERRLADAIDAVRDQYDLVLIDCPPSLGLLTVNALVAADQVVVPIQCEYYALEGLGQLMQSVEMVKNGLNQQLELGGVVMTMYDGRTNLSQQVVDEVRDHFGELAFQTVIPRTVRLSEAPSYGQPITEFDPSSRGARSYVRLGRELLERLGIREEPTGSPLDALLGTTAPGDASENLPSTSTNTQEDAVATGSMTGEVDPGQHDEDQQETPSNTFSQDTAGEKPGAAAPVREMEP